MISTHIGVNIYFITDLSNRGELFLHFHELPLGIVGESQLEYVQGYYINGDMISPGDFQFASDHLHIPSFNANEVK